MSKTAAVQDKLLTAASNAYIPEDFHFVASRILPVLPVTEQSGKLGKYGKDFLRLVNTVMGGSGKAARIKTLVDSTSSYYIEDHGLEANISKNDLKNFQTPYDAELDESLGLIVLMKIAKEKAIADALTDTATITQNTTLSGTAQFNDYTNSDPLGKFLTARTTVRDGIGFPPNKAIMDWKVANTLAYHPGILDALGFTQARAGQLTELELAKALGVDEVLIPRVMYNSAVEGQSDSLGAVWGKHIVFAYSPSVARRKQQSLGYEVVYEGEMPYKVFRYFPGNPPPPARNVIVTDDYDQLLSDVTGAYLIKNAIA